MACYLHLQPMYQLTDFDKKMKFQNLKIDLLSFQNEVETLDLS